MPCASLMKQRKTTAEKAKEQREAKAKAFGQQVKQGAGNKKSK